jgi:hypothetical protein
MISRKQKEKLDKVLSRLDMSKEVNDELTKFNQIESFDSNTEHGFLDELVKKITNLPKFNEIITSMTMTKAQFNEWFYSSCAFTLTNVAKNNLHHQKVIVFGDRVKEFEADTQSRR